MAILAVFTLFGCDTIARAQKNTREWLDENTKTETVDDPDPEPEKSPAEATILKMRQEACDGYVGRFFSYIDRDKVAIAMADAAAKSLEKDGKKASANYARNNARAVADEALRDWEDDIKKGRSGNICNWEIQSATTTTVTVKRRSGMTAVATFEETREGWKMVSYVGADQPR